MRKVFALVFAMLLAAMPVLAITYSAPSATVTRGNVLTILSAVTTGTSTVVTTDYKVGIQNVILFWHGTCTGGSAVIEVASVGTFDHTWAPVATIAAHSNIEDVVTVYVPSHSLRVRLASDVTGGGTLTVYYVGVNQ